MEQYSLEGAGSQGNLIGSLASCYRTRLTKGHSFGPQYFWYYAYSCYSLLDDGKQKLDEYGAFASDNYGMDTKEMGLTHLNLSVNLIGSSPYQSGAVVSILPTSSSDGPTTITFRLGVSFVSAEQACANLKQEVGNYSFDEIHAQSKTLWNEKLGRIELDLANTDANVTEMLYTSVYRSFLTPNNATGETNGAFAGTSSPFFDSLVRILNPMWQHTIISFFLSYSIVAGSQSCSLFH